MGWIESTFGKLAEIPGSPEAVLTGLAGGFSGKYSWNPYGSGVGVGDVIGGGTRESQDPQKRQYGRAAGTIVGAAFGLPALASYGTTAGAGTASGYTGASAGADAYGSLGGYGVAETGTGGTMSALGSGGYAGDYAAAGYDPGYAGAFEGGGGSYMGDMAAGFYDPGYAGPNGATWSQGGGNGLWDAASRYFKGKSAKDLWRMGMGAYSLYNTLAAQRQANRSIDVTSHPMYANMMESAMRQARAGGYQGSPMMAQAVAGKSAELYNQMYLEQQQRAANKMGSTYGSLSSLGLLASGFLGG